MFSIKYLYAVQQYIEREVQQYVEREKEKIDDFLKRTRLPTVPEQTFFIFCFLIIFVNQQFRSSKLESNNGKKKHRFAVKQNPPESHTRARWKRTKRERKKRRRCSRISHEIE